MVNKKRSIFSFPWDYKESFIVILFFVLIGFILQMITGNSGVNIPAWPRNLYILMGLIIALSFIHLFVKHPIIKWLSSVPAAISSLGIFTIFILIMGFIPQEFSNDENLITSLGLNQITSHWAFIISSFFLLIILGLTMIRRFLPFSIKNIAFTLNHLGLFIVIASASLGSSDMWRFNMKLITDRAIFQTTDQNNNTHTMPFAFKLLKFEMDEYTPKLGIAIYRDNGLYLDEGHSSKEVDTSELILIKDWEIEVQKHITNASPDSSGNYIINHELGAAHAVFIKAQHKVTATTISGWLCAGSYLYDKKNLVLDTKTELVLLEPIAKEYRSLIRAYKPNSVTEYEDITVKVNQPVKFFGYKVYQSGYDQNMGKYSQISYIELIYDPWLPIVYVGIFMILFGSLYLVWMGRNKND